jgi:hypothetical protein
MKSMSLIARRALLGRAILALAAAIAFKSGASAQELKDEDKIKKADALYQYQPKGQQRCAICLQFMPSGRCKIVQGPISPTGWCQYFAARENAH